MVEKVMKPDKQVIKYWYDLTADEAIDNLKSDRKNGLTHSEAQTRLKKYGLNELARSSGRSILSLFCHQFLSPLIYLLIVASGIAFTIGDKKDAIVILIVVVLNAVIGAIQEGRAEQSLNSLRKYAKLKVRVVRDGFASEIEASQLVPGDIFSVTAGDGVPTDARLLEVSSLAVAEAALTGESVPVFKNTSVLSGVIPLADRSNMIYAGTYITGGRCVAIAVASGMQNEIGKIADLTTATVQPKTQLEVRIQQFGKYIVYVALALFFAVIGIGLVRGIEFSEIFMIAVSQMVSLVPEGLPVALTVALAVGVQRMARRKTVVRRLSAVEALGSTTIICTDKTGTLTRNEMTVVSVYVPSFENSLDVTGVGYNLDGGFYHFLTKNQLISVDIQANASLNQCIEAVVCCNDSHVDIVVDADHKQVKVMGDPTEIALLVMAEKAGFSVQSIKERSPRISEIPFDSVSKMMATENIVNGQSCIYIKGAPEALLPLCYASYRSSEIVEEFDLSKVKFMAHQMANSALRVLAVGMIPDAHIDTKTGFAEYHGRVLFLGLIGEMDPPREEVAVAVQACLSAGIRPVMVTGDHKATGVAVAKALGIAKGDFQAIDGHELDLLSNDELANRIDDISVFARVHPSQKLKIVQAYQRKGHVVAMTGDGVNDAPALVQANVGVAMGITGTEVAKDASKIIITDDNFSTIIVAIAEGRLVYQNIKKLILFLFVTSIDEVLILFLALIAGYPPPFAAVQILWLNLVSEGALTINLIMEPAEGDEMKRMPIPVNEALLDHGLLMRMPLMVIASVVSSFGWYVVRSGSGVSADVVQTETFTVLVVSQWFNVLNCRSATRSVFSVSILQNRWLIGGLVLANILHALVIYWKPLSNFFHTTPIALEQFFIIGVVASLVLWVEEIRKYFYRKKYIKDIC